MPSIPDVAAKALRALEDPNISAVRIAELIAKDQGLTARVLKMANSAVYGLSREVRNLQQAAMVMGFNSLKSIIISVSARALYKRFGAVERSLWQHSVACACAVHRIASDKNIPFKEEGFVCGLMHDVGKVVMNNSERDKFVESQQLSRDQGISDTEAEQQVFGYTHCDVGSLLVQRWGLSEHLEHAVFLHHEPELAAILAEASEPLVYATTIADQICYHLGYGEAYRKAPGETMDLDAFSFLGYEESDLESLFVSVKKAYDETASSF
ncbi:MAG: HDOD domain-containing protein [Myxococcales bacterium]|nr:HDOD domain-containing protein [Myxococcales bacterium]